MSKLVIIFSGYNQRAIIAFLRTLSEKQIPFAIVTKGEDDPIHDTIYADRSLVNRTKKELDLEEVLGCINRLKELNNIKDCLIAPSTEALNRFLLLHRTIFEEQNCIIPLVQEGLYKRLSDKYTFGELCRQHDIEVPAEYKSVQDIILPAVAKPRTYYTGNSTVYTPYLLYTQTELDKFLASHNTEDFYFQEFVTGQSLYLLYYISINNKIYKLSQENLIQQPNGKSIVIAQTSDFHLSEEASKYESLLIEAGYHGMIMIELKKGRHTNYMIEANPRFWGPSQLFVDAEYNLFEALLYDYQFIEKLQLHSPKPAKYCWYGGICQIYTKEEELCFHKGDEEEFFMMLDIWLKQDVYKRKDTLKIFKQETICSK